MTPIGDPRRYAPAAARNRDPILTALRPLLPQAGLVLEIASGSGEHALHLAQALPGLVFQPSDPEADARASIDAWCAGQPNIRRALALDAAAGHWPLDRADAVVCINMIHISPWAATEGLMALAGTRLATGGLLVLYGPYREAEVPLAASNAAFDESLKARDPAWGLRDRDAVAAVAKAGGLALTRRIEMPANNLLLLFRRV